MVSHGHFIGKSTNQRHPYRRLQRVRHPMHLNHLRGVAPTRLKSLAPVGLRLSSDSHDGNSEAAHRE